MRCAPDGCYGGADAAPRPSPPENPFMPRILVFIPAYRCATTVARVIDQFDERVQRWVDTVIVVDNCSPDDTLDAAIERARDKLHTSHFIGWRNDANYGLGGAHKAAFRYALEHGFDHLVVLHGDGQADIRDLLPQLEGATYRNIDCLLGARFMRGSRLRGYSRTRRMGHQVYNALFSVVARRRIHDLGSGLNMYRLAAFREFYYERFPDDLAFNHVMLLNSFHAHQRVRFFPISWREDTPMPVVGMVRQAFRLTGLLVRFMFRRKAFLRADMRTTPIEQYSGAVVHDQDAAA